MRCTLMDVATSTLSNVLCFIILSALSVNDIHTYYNQPWYKIAAFVYKLEYDSYSKDVIIN